MEQGRCTAIVLAAGKGKRMHSKIQKQFLEIGELAGSVLFSALFSGKSVDPGYYFGDGEDESLIAKRKL